MVIQHLNLYSLMTLCKFTSSSIALMDSKLHEIRDRISFVQHFIGGTENGDWHIRDTQ